MNPIILIIISLSLLNLNSFAQKVQVIDLKDVAMHNGDSISVSGKVFGVTDGPLSHTYLLAVGNDFPKPVVKVWVVKIYDFQYYPTALNDIGEVTFTGKLEDHYGQIWMII